MEVVCIPNDLLDSVWPQARPLIESGLSFGLGEYETEDVYQDLQADEARLWLVIEKGEVLLALATQIIEFPRKRFLRIVSCGGTRIQEAIPYLDEALSEFGRERGCDYLETYGRPGWVRALSSIGFEPAYTTTAKAL